MLPTIDPSSAATMANQGDAFLVDIRSPAEHARLHIPGSHLAPLEHVEAADIPADKVTIFLCRTGLRTERAADRLAAAAPGVAYMLDGGLTAWIAAGLPVVEDRHVQMESERQVQILLGVMVLLGIALGEYLDPAWYWLAAATAAALVVTGVTGGSMLARFLDHMPWNRARG
ncbi:MAG: DUF2892 domain-containing protein [Alphaproteobacteria bacterium]|nr:MAG: DUF2892 domain-containing protein [Alphaproteobacteria bacterium]